LKQKNFLAIIDAIGPFFNSYHPEKTVNWSKIDFSRFERNKNLDPKRVDKLYTFFESFCKTVSHMGYNALSLDDLAHLCIFKFYPRKLEKKIAAYQKMYEKLFAIARSYHLDIYINTDIFFLNESIKKQLSRSNSTDLIYEACRQGLTHFNISGIILRIGESDGIDVRGDFQSELLLKTPRQTNRLLKQLLPLFEEQQKHLIFRTWTVGAHPIGDLMWNEKTFDRTFANIDSPSLIISMKYSDTDFFNHVALNPLFFHKKWKKIIELQTRREREGFGEFPYYVGHQYEQLAKELQDCDSLVGISVWCQTGGWSRWHNITFLSNSSIYNELNTYATLEIFKHNINAKKALKTYIPDKSHRKFILKFTELFDQLLYIKGFSDRPFYFKRVRIPPLLWVYWDHITINPLMILLLRHVSAEKNMVKKPDIKNLKKLGKKAELKHLDYYLDTLELLRVCRKALDRQYMTQKLSKKIARYHVKYPDSFQTRLNFSTNSYKGAHLLLRLALRSRAKYRWQDYLLMSSFVNLLFRIIISFYRKDMPKFVGKQAMKLDSIL
jgi:hypothetical protein